MIGKSFGQYEIVELLGKGGMGEVYRAHDSKLDRDVAIKLLPSHLTQDAERLARFEREAKVLASLNHPNIAAIYGLEEAEGVPFLVMELVEGETLAERIAKGPVDLEEMLQISRQIAEGLEAAHESGIIHRDLKPQNVKVTPEGRAKVLDFGLARAYAQETSGDPAESPTITVEYTRPGTLLGTAAYMSPEQARGKAVDKRGDIWAFGCVLYEMLTGKRAFEGETVSDTVAAILKVDPDWEELPDGLPQPLSNLARSCLQKNDRQRLRDMGDARLVMEGAFEASAADAEVPTFELRVWQRPVPLAIGVVVLVATAALLAWGVSHTEAAESRSTTYLPLDMPPGVSLTYNPETPSLAFSPDGRQLVVVGSTEDVSEQLYIQDLDQRGLAEPIPYTEGARNPFFSPDGNRIAFVAHSRLLVVEIGGGEPPTELTEVNHFRGGTWSLDGAIYFSEFDGGLQRIPVDGGTSPTRLTTPDRDGRDMEHKWPDVLPDGRILYTSCCFPAWIMLWDPATKDRKLLIENGYFGRYVATGSTGYILFAREGSLRAASFNPISLDVGDSFLVLDDLATGNEHVADYAVSRSGDLAYLSGISHFERVLVRVAETGERERVAIGAHPEPTDLRIDQNGKRVALSMARAPGVPPLENVSQNDVFIYDLDGDWFEQITTSERGDWAPIWTPDGKRVVFSTLRDGPLDLYISPDDRSTPPEPLFHSEDDKWAKAWHPVRDELTFEVVDPVTGADIWIYSPGLPVGADNPRPFLDGPYYESFSTFSPDGNWLAYQTDQDGPYEIYVVPYPDGGRPVRVSRGGGEEPRWSQDGRLFFRRRDTAMVVDLSNLSAANVVVPPSQPLPVKIEQWAWDVSRDGSFFITLEPREPPRLQLVLDWSESAR